MSLRNLLLTLLSFAAAVGASIYVVVSTWPAEDGSLGLPAVSHLLALLVFAGELGSRAVKIWFSARALGVDASLGTSARVCLGGDFGAAVTPARSGAEPARFLVMREAGVPVAGTLLVLFAELFLEMISIAVVAAALAIAFRGAGAMLGGIAGLVGGYAGLVLGVGGAGILLSRRYGRGAAPAWARWLGLRGHRWEAVQRSLVQLGATVRGLRTARRGPIALALLMSIAHVALRLLVLPALVLPSAPDAPLAPLFLWPLALLYGGVVVPVPGGGGVVEVAFKHALGAAIPAALMGPSLVWWRFYSFYLYVLLGAIAAGRTAMRAMRGGGESGEGDEADGGDAREGMGTRAAQAPVTV